MIKKVENGIYYEFKDNPLYFVAYGGKYFRVKNENNLITIFPKAKEYIRDYSRSNSSTKDQDYDLFIVSLFKGLTSNL